MGRQRRDGQTSSAGELLRRGEGRRGSSHLSEFVSTTTWSATPPATNIEEQRRQAIRQNDREVRKTIVRVIGRRLQGGADTSWSGNDFDFTGVLFEDAAFDGATFAARYASFDDATFSGKRVSFDDVRFAGEYVSFRRAGFAGEKTSFSSAKFKSLRASFDSPADWKNVELDWDNAPADSPQGVPRCITPRPWPPNLVTDEG